MSRWTKHARPITLIFILSALLIQPNQAQAEDESPIVHAVLFYSPACPHCHLVIDEVLPSLIEKYGEQLLIVGINIQSIEGQELYQAAVQYFQIPEERLGVPALVVGEIVLVGSGEIPAMFPGIIEKGLEEGGIPWPPIPGFVEVYTASVSQATVEGADQAVTPDQTGSSQPTAQSGTGSPQSTATQSPISSSTPEILAKVDETEPDSMEMALPNAESISLEAAEGQSMIETFKRDPAGNTASVIVLVGMILSLVGVWLRLEKPVGSTRERKRWVIPLLSVIGLFVAGYLSFIEITQSLAVCGPIGDCNTVQQSPYARLFGVLPIGVLGLMGYIAILIAWVAQYKGPERWRELAAQILWGFALFGTLFSVYLTFLEPFVIGATCAWCLSSAIFITLILWVATEPVRVRKPL